MSILTRMRQYSTWMILPILLAVIVGAGVVYREWRCSADTTNLLDELKASGVRLDADSQRRAFLEKTHSEGAEKLLAAIHMINALQPATEAVPLVGPEPINNDLQRGSTPYRMIVDYLELASPVMRLLEEALDCPKPIRLPVLFDGTGTELTSYQGIRGFHNVLSLQLEVSLMDGDAEDALRWIRLSSKLNDAVPKDVDGRINAIYASCNHCTWKMIMRSLATNLWNDEQLDELASLAAPTIDVESYKESQLVMVARKIQEVRKTGRLRESNNLPRLLRWPLRLPSLHNSALRRSMAFADYETTSLSALANTLNAQENTRASDEAVETLGKARQVFDVSYNFDMNTLIWAEDWRRLTLAAIAIKRYQLKNSSWPNELNDASGLSEAPLETVHGYQFGYNASDAEASIWTYSNVAQRTQPIPQEISKSRNAGVRQHYVTTIR